MADFSDFACRMADLSLRLKTLYRSAEAVRTTPGRRGRYVVVPTASEVLVGGDLHGHLANFQSLIRMADLPRNPRRHLVLQEVVHGKHRYPLGGDKSHQLLDLFAALKCQFPDRVHLLMGNHELGQWLARPIIKGGEDLNALFNAGIAEAYGESATDFITAYDKLFSVLPMAIRMPNRIFLSHSFPGAKSLPQFQLNRLEEETLDALDVAPGGSVFSLLWGRDTAPAHLAEFLRKVDADWLVSGHIPIEAGYIFPSERQLILDSCDMPACCALLPADEPLTLELFRASVRYL